MYNDTVTLFNRRRGKDGDVWYPTVLEGVDLNEDRAAIAAKYGSASSDKATLHVRYGWQGGPVAGGKRYMTPLLWQASEDPAAAFTFTAGEFFDFLVTGAWPNTEPVMDSDYPSGFYHHLNTTRDGVYAVSSAAQYSVIPHFEVTGK